MSDTRKPLFELEIMEEPHQEWRESIESYTELGEAIDGAMDILQVFGYSGVRVRDDVTRKVVFTIRGGDGASFES